jgi:hypothetical protein
LPAIKREPIPNYRHKKSWLGITIKCFKTDQKEIKHIPKRGILSLLPLFGLSLVSFWSLFGLSLIWLNAVYIKELTGIVSIRITTKK